MSVVSLHRKQVAAGWRPAELRQLEAVFAAYACRGEASEWAVGATELGAPQFYLLGPAPDHDCLLCISRLDRLYVLEDGKGKLLAEESALSTLVARVTRAAARRGGTVVAGLVYAWHATRRAVEEKLEPLLAEPVEVLSHIAPQIAVLA
jgi:hypothetical protein